MHKLFVAMLLVAAMSGHASPASGDGSATVGRGEASAESGYPPARRTDTADTFHGVRVLDPYRWMEDLRSPDLEQWIDAQNRLSAPRVEGDPAYPSIRERLEQLGKAFPKQEPGREVGGRMFHRELVDNKVLLFVQGRDDASSRVLLDPAALGEGNELKAYEPSQDGRYMAYVVGKSGADWGEIRIRELTANRDLPVVLPNVRFEGPMQWTADGGGLVYRRFAPPRDGKLEAPAEGQAVYLHRVGTNVREDARLYELPAELRDWSLALNLPGDRSRLFVYPEQGPWHYSNLGGSRAQIILLALDPDGRRRAGVAPRVLTKADAAYRVLHVEAGRALVFTDKDAPRRRVVAMDLAKPEPSEWKDVIPEGEGVLEDAGWFGGRLVAHFLENVHSAVRVFDASGKPAHDIQLPGTGVVQGIYGAPASSRVSLFYSGLLQSHVVLNHDLASSTTKIGSVSPNAPDLGAFEVRQEWFKSKDGTKVPLFVVARRGLSHDRSHPTLLYAYGASSTSELPSFRADAAAWLQMGGVYALANVRGGGEFGKAWYEAAIRERKQASFDALIAASEHLIAQGWTTPSKLAITGGSNGGLLVTATSLQRPDLFGAVLADVPVTDAMRRHLAGNGQQAVEQWGTPEDPVVFPALLAYSPVHNVTTGKCYPPTLITTARDDQRLPPWHSYKFAAALQAAQGCDSPVMLHVRASGGHNGGDFAEWLDGLAGPLAFAARQLGLSKTNP